MNQSNGHGEALVTVFTATYNREQLLPRLFESLQKQTIRNFCWLIVDDGSTDGTARLVEEFKKKARFAITYYQKENGGQPSAQNFGTMHAQTPLFFEVDSDDYLPPDAIEIIASKWPLIENNDSIAGILAYDGTTETKRLGKALPSNVEAMSVADSFFKYKVKNDLALVFKTAIRKQYSFPLYPGEKCMGPSYIHFQIDQKFKMLAVPKILKIVEYQEGGLSDQARALPSKNPHNYMNEKLQAFKVIHSPIQITRYLLLFLVAALFAGDTKQNIERLPTPFLRLYALPLLLPAEILKRTMFRPERTV